MAKKGKRYRQAQEVLAAATLPADLESAAVLVKKTALAKFDESVGIDIRLGVDPRHADQMVRGSVALPHGTGKEVRVLVMANESKQAEAREAGAEFVGLDEFVAKIQDGWTDIDVIIATPDVMGKVGRLGRVLGPRGLMPNPKSGTVTMDVVKAINEVKAGRIDFRVDRFGILHAGIGKTSFTAEQIQENVTTFLKEVIRLRPASAKGTYVKSVTLSATMGPAIPIDRAAVTAVAR